MNPTDISDILTLTKQTTAKTAKILRAVIIAIGGMSTNGSMIGENSDINDKLRMNVNVYQESMQSGLYILDVFVFCFYQLHVFSKPI